MSAEVSRETSDVRLRTSRARMRDWTHRTYKGSTQRAGLFRGVFFSSDSPFSIFTPYCRSLCRYSAQQARAELTTPSVPHHARLRIRHEARISGRPLTETAPLTRHTRRPPQYPKPHTDEQPAHKDRDKRGRRDSRTRRGGRIATGDRATGQRSRNGQHDAEQEIHDAVAY